MPLPDLLKRLTPTEKVLVDGLISDSLLWMPHPENIPQIRAYVTEADVLYYGGAAGGGKSDLLLGLAVTTHQKSIIFRREFSQLRELVDRSAEILVPTGAKYNQTYSRWMGIPGGRTLEFGAVQHEQFKEKYKGRPHDLVGFDEVGDFTETQFRFLIAWTRSVDPKQRCRIVCTGNPPSYREGEWVIRYWAPWLSDDYSNPAVPGELRYFATVGGKDVEFPDSNPIEHEGEVIRPLSRTFIPASLSDNPFLRNTSYGTVLQSLPEPLRSQLLFGDFSVRRSDTPRQVIPTEWVRAAQRRWRDREPPDAPLTAVGVDPSRGGVDNTEIARLTENYFHELLTYPGETVPDGPACAGNVLEALGEDTDARINVDVIGIGASVFDILASQELEVYAINFSERTNATDQSGELRFHNVRAEAYWRLREALDPTSGEDLALPPSDELLADLVAPLWRVSTRGIQIEAKKDIRKRLKRSPGKGDAVALAYYNPTAGIYFM